MEGPQLLPGIRQVLQLAPLAGIVLTLLGLLQVHGTQMQRHQVMIILFVLVTSIVTLCHYTDL